MIESDYLTAQREAEMAAARAEEKRNLLDSARLEKDKILETLKSLSFDVDSQTEIVNQTTVKTQKLKSKFETSQADLSQKTLGYKEIRDPHNHSDRNASDKPY